MRFGKRPPADCFGLMQSINPRRGEIWFAYIPGRPGDPHQPRPALVVSEDVRNRFLDHVIVVPMYSAGRSGPTHVAIDAGEGGLRRPSVLFCEELSTLDHEFLNDGPLGRPVSGFVLDQVVRAIRRAIGEAVPVS